MAIGHPKQTVFSKPSVICMNDIVKNTAKTAIIFFALLSGFSLGAHTIAIPHQTVTLAWYPNASPIIAGYKVYFGTASQVYNHVLDLGDNTAAQITNLVAGSTYYFAVTAYTSFGLESAPSGEISYVVPMPPSGSYSGLFYESAGVALNSAGCFTMQVSPQGTYSGKLQLAGKNYPFGGKLGPQAQATTQITRPGNSTLTLKLNVQADEVSGQLTDNTWVANLDGKRASYNARTNAAPYSGTYTLVVSGQQNDATQPAGSGYGTARVDGNGAVRFTGALADGTKISQSATISKDGQWPLYASLYSGKGLVMGWLTFSNQAASDLSGALSWLKNVNVTARYYSAGFINECVAVGSAFVPPTGMNGILNLTHGHLSCTGGNLASGFTNMLMLANNHGVAPDLTVTFSLSTGLFTGRTTDPTNGQTYSFGGAVLQKINAGYGFLLGTDQSSDVVLSQ
jgi:hypothetical protein